MPAIWLCVRAEWRGLIRTWVTLTLLLGVSAGLVIALASGARRTESALPRLLETHGAAQFQIPNYGFLDFAATFPVETIRAMPEVEAVAAGRFGLHERGMWFAPYDETFGHDVNRWKVLQGRTADPARADEAVVTFLSAEERKIRVGDRIDLPASREALAGFGIDGDPVTAVTVVGIVAGPGDFPPNDEDRPSLYLTPAFARDIVPQMERRFAEAEAPIVFRGEPSMYVRLRDATATSAFRRHVEELARPKSVIMLPQHQQDRRAQRSVTLQSTALWLLCGLAGVAVLLVLSQAFARHTMLASSENPTRRALGMSRRALFFLGMIRVTSVAVPAAVIAVVLAIGLSPLAPVGLARIAEPAPGLAMDWTVLLAGIAAIVLLVPLLAAIPAWRGATETEGSDTARVGRPSRFLARARAILPVSAGAGVSLALHRGRGRSAVPVRSTIAGVLLSLAAVAASLTFARNLDGLLATPALYGRSFDLWIANDPEGFPAREHLDALRAQPEITSIAIGTPGESYPVDGIEAAIVPFEAVTPGAGLTMLEGRAPRGGAEIALGTRTLAMLGKRVNPGDPDHVEIVDAGKRITAAIVGRVVVPPLTDRSGFGEGGVVHPDLMNRFVEGSGDGGAFVRLAPGADADALIARLRAATGIESLYHDRFAAPADVVNFGRIEHLPLYLAGVLGALAFATLTHTIVSAVRRRRRDLAILKTLGFVRRQTGGTVIWQAATLSTVALAIGLPSGVAGGRWLWMTFADRLGVVSDPQVPLIAIAALIPAALLLACLAALFPARSASRTQPALVLRSE